MADTTTADTTAKETTNEQTAVDDVRRIREQIDREAGGDIRKHVEQTNAIVEQYRQELGLRLVEPPSRTVRA